MTVFLMLLAMAIVVVVLPILFLLFRVGQILAMCALGWLLSRGEGHRGNRTP